MPVLIIVLFIITVIAVFSVQNAAPVSISFLVWKFEASLAIVIYLLVLLGIVLGMIITYWLRFRSSLRKTSIKETEDEAVQ